MELFFKKLVSRLQKGITSPARPSRPRRARPGLEALEDRIVPSNSQPIVSPNGWHTAYIQQTGPYFAVVEMSKGPSTLSFTPLGNPVPDGGTGTVLNEVNSGLQYSSDSSTLSFVGSIDFLTQPYTEQLTNPTSISVTESTPTSIYGQSVKYTATVTVPPATATPTAGSVGFYVDGGLVAYASLAGSNTASLSLNSLSGGTHQITAQYIGNAVGFYASQTSLPVSETVTAAASTSMLVESMPSSFYGQAVSLTTTVRPVTAGLGTPTGSVSFFDNGNALGTANLNASGQAQLSIASLNAGNHTLTAWYNGSVNFSPSQANAVSEPVTPASTILTLAESGGISVFDQAVSFAASISPMAPGAGIPNGSVSFFDNGGLLSTVPLNSSGAAVFSTPSLPAGSNHITASYAGSMNYSGSQSPLPVSDTVSLSLGTPTLPAETAGQPYSTTITAAGGSGHYSYMLLSGALPIGLSLSAAGAVTGIATVARTYTFTVSAKDMSQAGVTGVQTDTLTVTPGAPAVISVLNPSKWPVGAPFNLGITAKDAYGNNSNGTLTLTSSDGQKVLPSTVTVSNGIANAPITLDVAGTVTLTAADGSAHGVGSPITVSPGALAGFGVNAPSSATAGTAFNVTVKAQDSFGNAIPTYNGSATLYSSDNQKVGAVTLTNGVGTTQVTLDSAHPVTLSAYGTGLSGISKAIVVNPTTPVVTLYTPPVVPAGAAFGITVKAMDVFGNGYNGSFMLTSSDGQKVLLSPSIVNLVNGYATFGVTLDTTDKLTLTATVAGISAASNSITVLPAGVASFVVSAPSTATAGSAFLVSVTAKDPFGNITTTYNGQAYLISSDGQAVNPVPVELTNGVGSSTVTLNKADKVTLAAVLNGAKGSSNIITINPAAMASFTVSAPSTATAGTVFNVLLTAHDAFGNVATGYNGPATLTSSDGQKVTPAAVTLANGVATVPVTLHLVHTVTLTAVAGSGKGVSTYITVSPGAPALIALSAPSKTTAGTFFLVTIQATDAFGNTVTAPVTMSSSDGQKVYSNPIWVVNGAVTAYVDLNTADTLTLTANIGTAKGVSGSLTVNPAAPVAFGVSAPSTATAGTAFAVTVTAHDAFGNTVTAYSGAVTLYSSDKQPVQLSSPLTLSNGVGTARVTLDVANPIALTAIGGGLGGVSGLVTVNSALASTAQIYAPTVVQAGNAFQVTVTAKDKFGNNYTGPASLTSSDGQLAKPISFNMVNGVGYALVTLDMANALTLTASVSGVASSINITVIPAALASFVVSAPSTATVGTGFNLTVTAKDAFGNTVTGYTGLVYLLSSDGQQVTPFYIQLTKGVGTAPVTLNKANTVKLTAYNYGIKGVSGNILVS